MQPLFAATRSGVAAFMTFAGAVLAGGASLRMGRPKAFIEIAGRPMVANVADALRAAGADPVMVVGGDSARIASLRLRAEPDLHPGEGPLGGIVTALRLSTTAEAVAVLSCDLVVPSACEIRRLADERGDDDVVVPVDEHRPQWTHAAWSLRALPALEAAFARGARAPRHAVSDLSVRRVEIDRSNAAAYVDADTTADLPDDTVT